METPLMEMAMNVLEDAQLFSMTKESQMYREERIRTLKILLREPLTPLLESEIRHAIKLDSESKDDDSHAKDVDVFYSRIMKHWTKIYGSLVSRAYLLDEMRILQLFLTAQLLQDYANGPSLDIWDEWVQNRARAIQTHYAAKDSSNRNTNLVYHGHFAFPVEELMLSLIHVEKRVLSAANRQAASESYIQHLISGNDWSSLAATLTSDRDLAKSLFDAKPIVPDCFSENTRRRVLQGIANIESRYFDSLYPHAVALPNDSHYTETHVESSLTRNIYNAITSVFGGTSDKSTLAKDL